MPGQRSQRASPVGETTPPPEALVSFVRALARVNFRREHPELAPDLDDDQTYEQAGCHIRPVFIR